jgi:hypothetical protein
VTTRSWPYTADVGALTTLLFALLAVHNLQRFAPTHRGYDREIAHRARRKGPEQSFADDHRGLARDANPYPLDGDSVACLAMRDDRGARQTATSGRHQTMILFFRKARRAQAIEQMRDDALAAVRTGKMICEKVQNGSLSEDDRQAHADAVDLFKMIERDLTSAQTQDEILAATKETMELVNNQWFKHLVAGNTP